MTTQSALTPTRDAAGRLPGAAAWDGDLAALTDDELHRRIESLAKTIGNAHTMWKPLAGWRAATPAEPAEREVSRWVVARLAALEEQERRHG